MKKVLPLLIAALMALSLFAGCSLTQDETNGSAGEPTSAPTSGQAADTIADDAPVVTVDGNVVLTWSEFKNLYDFWVNYYTQYYGMAFSEEEVLSYFTRAETSIIAYYARQEGFGTLTEAQQAELDGQIDAELADLEAYYRSTAEEEAAADASIDVDARTKELIAADSIYYAGKTMSYDDYIAWEKERITDRYLGTLMQDKVYETVTVDDAYLETWYNNALISQTSDYDTYPDYYLEDQQSFELGVEGAAPVLYVPEGYARVMDILIAPKEALPEDYDAKISKLDELRAEYGDLSFQDAVNGTSDNGERLAEIIAEYNALKAETDAMLEAHTAEAKTAIEAAYAELEAGAPFSEVLAKYTENELFTGSEVLQQKGALLDKENNSDWSEAVMERFALLSAGAYSAVFEDDDGYHILFYVGDETPGIRDFGEVKELIRSTALEDKKTEEWNALLETWKAGEKVVIDESLLALVSTAAVG